jgi:hypothetical protein
MHLGREARVILVDTSVFYRFCDAGLLSPLKSYLASRARITREVGRELFVAPLDNVHRDLASLQNPPWPKKTGQVPTPLRPEANRLKDEARLREARAKGVDVAEIPAYKHAGEVTTVLMAEHLGANLVIIDDDFGKSLARARKVPRISTAQLILQMVIDGRLSEDQGFAVFDLATPADVGRSRYDSALREARVEMGSGPTGA